MFVLLPTAGKSGHLVLTCAVDRDYGATHDALMPTEAFVAEIERWDGSLAIRLPSAMVARLDLKEGDDAELILLHEQARTRQDRTDWIMRLRLLRGRMPSDFKFDREEANER
jgi:antitoxin MazE